MEGVQYVVSFVSEYSIDVFILEQFNFMNKFTLNNCVIYIPCWNEVMICFMVLFHVLNYVILRD